MKPQSDKWIVVSDFDGTICREDIGNALCLEVIPKKFQELHARYRLEEITLMELQTQLWSDFPMNKNQFIECSLKYSELNFGAKDFFAQCATQRIPVYVASCGIRTYIEATLEKELDETSFNNISDIQCNDVVFGEHSTVKFLPANKNKDASLSLDKGEWCETLRANHGPHCKILAIGNGTSDRSFVGHVDILAATDALAIWCNKNHIEHVNFTDMTELLKLPPFLKR